MRSVHIIIIFLFLVVNASGQESFERNSQYFEPNKNLVIDGIPKIPKSLSSIYDSFWNASYYSLNSWVLSGKGLLAYKNQRGSTLFYIPGPGIEGKEILSIKPEDGYILDLYFNPQGNNLIYRNDVGGSELYQFFYYDPATKKSTKLTLNNTRNIEPIWSRNGKFAVWGSSQKKDDDGMELQLIEPLNNKSLKQLVPSIGTYLEPSDWSPDDQSVIYTEYISRKTDSRIWAVDVTTDQRKLLLPSGKKKAYYSNARFSIDGTKIYFITDQNFEFRRLASYDLKSKKITYLSGNINWDVEKFVLSPNGKTLAFVTNENGRSILRFFYVDTNKFSKPINTSMGIISKLVWNNSSSELAFNLNSPRAFQDIYVLHVQKKEIVCWSKYRQHESQTNESPLPEIIQWKSFDNRVISGYLYKPKQISKKLPVLIDIHGGPDSQRRPSFFPKNDLIINMLGIVIIHPNIRGSSGYGKTFLTLDDGIKRMDALKDIYYLLEWIKRQPELDSNRIVVSGGSAGGYMSYLVASNYGDKIRAAICGCGMTNLVSFIENRPAWNTSIYRNEWGDDRDSKVRTELDKVAPRNNVDKINIPLFIYHGKNDPQVPISESTSMIDLLKARGKTVWYMVGNNDGHCIINRDNATFRDAVLITFLKKYLVSE